MRGTELLISRRPYSDELPTKITQALTLLACIRMSAGTPTVLAHFVLFLILLKHMLG